MIGNTFLHVARGNRLENYLRLRPAVEGQAYKLGKDYTYIELPLWKAEDLSKDIEVEEKMTRNSSVLLSAPYSVSPVLGYKAMVSINPVVLRYANAPAVFMLDYSEEPSKAQPLSIVIQMRRDLKIAEIDWLFRVYMLS